MKGARYLGVNFFLCVFLGIEGKMFEIWKKMRSEAPIGPVRRFVRVRGHIWKFLGKFRILIGRSFGWGLLGPG